MDWIVGVCGNFVIYVLNRVLVLIGCVGVIVGLYSGVYFVSGVCSSVLCVCFVSMLILVVLK